ncbi:MAG: 4Fe-4S binding protein, partial [Burkholderia sp.]|nr:4Fe-4S binding protein [Burkholderia sp.]
AILVGANTWSAWLAWKVTGRYAAWPRRLAAFAWFAAGLAVVDSAWWLMFWGF